MFITDCVPITYIVFAVVCIANNSMRNVFTNAAYSFRIDIYSVNGRENCNHNNTSSVGVNYRQNVFNKTL